MNAVGLTFWIFKISNCTPTWNNLWGSHRLSENEMRTSVELMAWPPDSLSTHVASTHYVTWVSTHIESLPFSFFLLFFIYLFIYQTLLSSQYFIAVETTSLPILLENTQKSAKTKFHLHTSHLFFLLNAWLDIDVVGLRKEPELMSSSKYSHLLAVRRNANETLDILHVWFSLTSYRPHYICY